MGATKTRLSLTEYLVIKIINDENEKCMIQANELRTGNFVRYRGVKRVTVRGVNKEDVLIAGDFVLNIKIVDPIPLTEEWLIKFGFEKDGFSAFIKDISYFGDNGIPYRILCFSGDYLYIRDGMLSEPRHKDSINILWNKDIMKQFYVHQLQNLFFALTGNELNLSNDTRY